MLRWWHGVVNCDGTVVVVSIGEGEEGKEKKGKKVIM